MKRFTLILMIAAISGVMITGCKKAEVATPVTPLPKTLNELKASDAFSWTTGNTVEVMITGLPTSVPVRATLTISLADGTILFSKLHPMDQNLTISLTVPSTDKELTLKYGSVSYPVAIVNNQAAFSFIPVLID